jgi:hypothetical protein
MAWAIGPEAVALRRTLPSVLAWPAPAASVRAAGGLVEGDTRAALRAAARRVIGGPALHLFGPALPAVLATLAGALILAAAREHRSLRGRIA